MSPAPLYTAHADAKPIPCLSPPLFMPSMTADPVDYTSDDNDGDSLYTPPLQEQYNPDFRPHSVPQHHHSFAQLSDPRPSPLHQQHIDLVLSPSSSKHQHLNVSHVSRPLSPFSPVFFPSALKHDPSGELQRTFTPPFHPNLDHRESTLSLSLADINHFGQSNSNATSISPNAVHSPRLHAVGNSPDLVHSSSSTHDRSFPQRPLSYHLGDELGAGGYGFVMTACHRIEGCEVAVKFIIKAKVPEHAWMEDKHGHRVPTEALLLGLLDHKNIVKCIDLFEDALYFYLVQELHGTPWVSTYKDEIVSRHVPVLGKLEIPSYSSTTTPALTPSSSEESDDYLLPGTPPLVSIEVNEARGREPSDSNQCYFQSHQERCLNEDMAAGACSITSRLSSTLSVQPQFLRRPSHDLFECIEQSQHKRLSEAQARYIFAQVVEAVYYLDSQGVTHCDIKDENILVDEHLRVKLVDFGSAVVVDPTLPRPYYTLFFGTTAYAASEVLQKKAYQAPPAEIWTLGVLLSYLLTGASPFPTERDAIKGRVVLSECVGDCVSIPARALMLRCLDPDPQCRADIEEVRGHLWLRGAFDYEKMAMDVEL
ncbi:hypothetical protein EW146_g192 [Bondarzewia mesenterica]|uniref:Protein kinase domain-containing protein n=1 Tax=Bondarzewia mesenterica TaxID=1095465 RepID=A0A4S4M9Z1_9AGAM|nr:hypothetical protein EW146_g192 [Bondarzewia mesenterica]